MHDYICTVNAYHLDFAIMYFLIILYGSVVKFSRETDPVRYMDGDREVSLRKLFIGLAHSVTEAEKSPDLQSASWKPKKTSDVIQYNSEGLRTTG